MKKPPEKLFTAASRAGNPFVKHPCPTLRIRLLMGVAGHSQASSHLGLMLCQGQTLKRRRLGFRLRQDQKERPASEGRARRHQELSSTDVFLAGGPLESPIHTEKQGDFCRALTSAETRPRPAGSPTRVLALRAPAGCLEQDGTKKPRTFVRGFEDKQGAAQLASAVALGASSIGMSPPSGSVTLSFL